MTLNLRVHDATGGRAAVADEAGLGGGEALHRRAFEGAIYVTVGQTMVEGQRPIENVSDAYELTVTEERADAGEVEPNNADADATQLVSTHELQGYLDSKTDVDVLRWTGESGSYIVVVRGDGVQWKLADGKPRTPGEASIELQQGSYIRIERMPNAPARNEFSWSIVVVGRGR
jgi:hypothetical protein